MIKNNDKKTKIISRGSLHIKFAAAKDLLDTYKKYLKKRNNESEYEYNKISIHDKFGKLKILRFYDLEKTVFPEIEAFLNKSEIKESENDNIAYYEKLLSSFNDYAKDLVPEGFMKAPARKSFSELIFGFISSKSKGSK